MPNEPSPSHHQESSLPMTDLVERLEAAARQASEFSKRMAEHKTRRNREAGDKDALYGGVEPEQTLEGQAAAALREMGKEIYRLDTLLKASEALKSGYLELAALEADGVQARENLLAYGAQRPDFEQEYRSAAEAAQDIASAIRSLKGEEHG